MVFFNKLFLIDDPNFWKLDKIDKIVITLILLIGCISSCLSCFATSSENVDFNVVDNVGINTNGVLISYTGDHLAYFKIEPGYRYTVSRSISSFKCGFSDTVPEVNLQLDNFQQYLTTFTFTYSDYNYFYFNFANYTDGTYTVTRVPLEGMNGAVDDLSYYAGYNIWESFTNSLPFVLPLVLVCFGMYIISHFVNKNSKGV